MRTKRTTIAGLPGIAGLVVALSLGAAGRPAAAGEQPAPMLVTPAWLANHLQEPGMVLLHVGDRKDFDEAHLPGARFLGREAISRPRVDGSLSLELPAAETLVEHLEALGISDDSRIVLYFGTDWLTPTTRAWFTLDYLGLGERASILDGGMPAWVAEGRPTTKDVRGFPRGRITARPRPEVLADAGFVKAHLQDRSVVLVDSRLAQFYDGSDKGMMPRAGRIPGAKSIPFASLAEENGRLKDKNELKERFARAGVPDDSTVVTYCHIGQQASLGYFVARYLGYTAKLYDGSFEEWSRRAELPVEGGGVAK